MNYTKCINYVTKKTYSILRGHISHGDHAIAQWAPDAPTIFLSYVPTRGDLLTQSFHVIEIYTTFFSIEGFFGVWGVFFIAIVFLIFTIYLVLLVSS
jgi:hypothetical protein